MSDIYRADILDHARHPRHKGILEAATHTGRGSNPRCGDACTVQLKIVDGAIEAAAFDGYGCALSTAAASLLTDSLAGKSAPEVSNMGDDEFLQTWGLSVTSGRIDCVLLPLRALRDALK